MLIATILGLLQWMFARQIADFLHVPELVLVSRVLAVMMVANAFNLIAEAILSRHLKFKISSIARLVAWIASHVGLAIPLAYFGFSYWALVVAYMAEALILASIYFFIARDYLVRPSFDMQVLPRYPQTEPGLFAGWYIDLHRQIYRQYYCRALDRYRRAGHLLASLYLIAMPATLFGNLNKSVVFPLLSKVQDDKARLRTAQLKGYALTAALALPFSAFLSTFANELVLTVLGQKWVDAVVPIMAFLQRSIFASATRFAAL